MLFLTGNCIELVIRPGVLVLLRLKVQDESVKATSIDMGTLVSQSIIGQRNSICLLSIKVYPWLVDNHKHSFIYVVIIATLIFDIKQIYSYILIAFKE